MYPGVIKVEPAENYFLRLYFDNGEKKLFDVKPYLNTGLFTELTDIKHFNTVRVSFDTIIWENGIDIDPEILYLYGTNIET